MPRTTLAETQPKPDDASGPEFERRLHELPMTRSDFAERSGVLYRQIQRWVSEDTPVPKWAWTAIADLEHIKWLEAQFAAYQLKQNPPTGGKRGTPPMESGDETQHLLSSPANAARVLEDARQIQGRRKRGRPPTGGTQ